MRRRQAIYSAIASLDGFVEDEAGTFDWAAPDEEVHAFVNDLERPVGITSTAAACTRRWPAGRRRTPPAGRRPVSLDFTQIWQAADKVVYSTTLETAATRERGSSGSSIPRPSDA